MKVYCVDTNVFLRFILKDNDLLFKKASELLEKASKGKVQLFTPSIVIFEMFFVLRSIYNLSKEEIVENLESILSSSYVRFEDLKNIQHALSIYEKHPALSLVDCFLLVKSEAEGAELFTFDKKLAKIK